MYHMVLKFVVIGQGILGDEGIMDNSRLSASPEFGVFILFVSLMC